MVTNIAGASKEARPGGTPPVLRTPTVDRIVGGASARPARAFDWRSRYATLLLMTDFAVIAAVVFGTQALSVGWWGQVAHEGIVPYGSASYLALSVLIIGLWMLALALNDTRSDRVIGVGTLEYKRIFDTSIRLFGVVAIAAFLLRLEIARGYLLLALPLGLLALFAERWLWRRWLGRRRARGEYSAGVLLVGSDRTVAHIAKELRRSVGAGYRVVGACTPTGLVGDHVAGSEIPVMGRVDAIEAAIEATDADTIIVTSTDEVGPERVKQISWALEAGRQHLVLAPSITDIAGPRIHMRPVAGLPLMHVETPRFSAGQRFLKRSVDLFGSAVLILLLSPLLLVLALLVRITSPGPAIFRQQRVGRHGQEFRMLKFRSMVQDAESRLPELIASNRGGLGNEVMFKMRADPRITPLGRFMRRYSLDELPQLFNVLGGSMSLVGPRPPLPREVDRYADHVHRRFLVKPGITGLWQVSGRSTLEWDDTVRLDLAYVENWNLLGDLLILAKTARAAAMPGDTAA